MNLITIFQQCEDSFRNIKHEGTAEPARDLINKFKDLATVIPSLEELELHQVLNLRNKVRAYCLPQGKKALKGLTFGKIAQPLQKSDGDDLRAILKHIRKEVLNKHYAARLMQNRVELDLLKNTLPTLSLTPSKREFLIQLLGYWEKKHNSGKPISIPKWYHCTPKVDNLRSILTSDIRFESGGYDGAFVSNKPALSFGTFGIALSSKIEITGIQDPTLNKLVYPKCSREIHPEKIVYSDIEKPFQGGAHPLLWLGFQRGKEAHHLGIPVRRKVEIISDKSLEYYDTAVAFIFAVGGNDQEIEELTKNSLCNRVLFLNKDQMEAVEELVSNTFELRLHTSWYGQILRYPNP